MAIYESLTYAIYHGNLELETDLRQSDEAIFCRLAVERRGDEPYASRRVRFSSRFSDTEARFVVSDDGSGNKPSERQNSIDAINLEGIEGRGLLLIHSFMDEVTHNLQGNEITMVKRVLARNSDSSSAMTNAAS
jgi:anti-sigma regulatory factor (Ser/Thr protein kinase)